MHTPCTHNLWISRNRIMGSNINASFFCSLVFYSIYWASEYKNHYLKGIIPSLKIHPTPPKHMQCFILILGLSFYHVKLAGILHYSQCHSDLFLWQSFLFIWIQKDFFFSTVDSKMMTCQTGQHFLVSTHPEAFVPVLGDQASLLVQPCLSWLI